MKFFKNAAIYRMTRDVIIPDELENLLEHCQFTPCGSQDMARTGWVPPMGEAFSDQLAHISGGHILLTVQREEKILPAPVVKQALEAKIAKLEAEQQRKLKKTEKDTLKDEVIHSLLPRAFSRYTQERIWINTQDQLIVVDASSAKRAEDCLALLRKTLGSLPVVPLTMETPIELTMTEWVRDGNTPAGMSLLDEAELKAVLEEGGTVRCKKQALVSDEVSTHIEAGKRVTSVGIDWQERIQFTLTDSLQLKRIKPATGMLEQNDDIDREDVAARFDADFCLMAGEMSVLIGSLITALGGEAQR
ncbi:recombination associated protein [Tatumella morbirosei]|uniref:Recombination-associated protein RdgC n=1 Tax=Tatumella morbirosei TaxID=642227 RepID=A0A095TEZ1_9GAMM|nr:recombination-associated protein RdgC [Tatumella morbirosei]KGD75257.1 recombination associated protein [Tatumella morbirosei]